MVKTKKTKIEKITEFEFDEAIMFALGENRTNIVKLQMENESLTNSYLRKERAKEAGMVMNYESKGDSVSYFFELRKCGFK